MSNAVAITITLVVQLLAGLGLGFVLAVVDGLIRNHDD